MFLHVPWPDWYEEYAQINAPEDDDGDARVPLHGRGAGATTILRDTAAFFNKAWPNTTVACPGSSYECENVSAIWDACSWSEVVLSLGMHDIAAAGALHGNTCIERFK